MTLQRNISTGDGDPKRATAATDDPSALSVAAAAKQALSAAKPKATKVILCPICEDRRCPHTKVIEV